MDLRPGDRVSFELELATDERGRQCAVRVEVLS
jgi:hypothetical protein